MNRGCFLRIVQTEGSRQVTCDMKHCNLQMIIADQSLCAGGVWAEIVQLIYLTGKAEMWLKLGRNYNLSKREEQQIYESIYLDIKKEGSNCHFR